MKQHKIILILFLFSLSFCLSQISWSMEKGECGFVEAHINGELQKITISVHDPVANEIKEIVNITGIVIITYQHQGLVEVSSETISKDYDKGKEPLDDEIEKLFIKEAIDTFNKTEPFKKCEQGECDKNIK